MTPKTQTTKVKIGLHKKNFCVLMDNTNGVKRQPTGWEKISVSYISDKGLLPIIDKELLQLQK